MDQEEKITSQTSPTPLQPTADPIAPAPKVATGSGGNTSGQGSGAVVPEEVKGWSWGGFFLSWIWAIGNSVWIGLLALVPYVGFVMSIILGIKGREWAWQSKKWDSVDHFKRVQKNWTIAGIILGVISIVAVIFITTAIFAVALNSPESFEGPEQIEFQYDQ